MALPQASMPSEEFGRWAQRARLALPMPLSAAPAARHDLDIDELVAELSGTSKDPARDVPRTAREALFAAEPLLRDPALSLYAVRVTAGGEEQHVVGLARGRESVVIVDTPSTTTIKKVAADQLASGVIASLPTLRGLPIASLEVSARTLSGLTAGASLSVVRAAAATAGVSADDLGRVVRAAGDCRAAGVVGAIRFQDGVSSDPDPRAVDWFEAGAGAVIKRRTARGWQFEPATRASLTKAAALLAAAAR